MHNRREFLRSAALSTTAAVLPQFLRGATPPTAAMPAAAASGTDSLDGLLSRLKTAEQLGVAMDQRRQLPAALRAFVRRNGRMDGGGTLVYLATLLTTSVGASAAIGIATGFATFALGATLAPLIFAITSARRLTQLGFARVSSHALLGYGLSPEDAFGVLRRLLADPRHRFVADVLSCQDRIVRTDLMRGPNQVTDRYLVALARHHRLKLATLDEPLAKDFAGETDLVLLVK